MHRAAASRVRALKSQRSSGLLKSYATSAAAVSSTSSGGGILSWLTGATSPSKLPPLDFPLEGVTIPPPVPDAQEIQETKLTKLKNGFRIASEASASPTASIGLFVESGSIYEEPHTFGATHLLERMAFKSTLNRSSFRMVREVEATGGAVTASASRDQMVYTFDALKTYLPQMVELLVDSARNPAFLDWEVKEQIEHLKEEVVECSKNSQHMLMEGVHNAAYMGAFGNPLMASESGANKLDSDLLETFVRENYTAPRMVLAATGVDHEELLKYATPLVDDMPLVQLPTEPEPVYVGGDFRNQTIDESTHFALAFEVPGGWRAPRTAMVATVLQMLMGGGGSFSAGGPGKGMYSRLYLRVLNKYPQMQMFSAFTSIYNESGLFGLQATTSPDFAAKAIDVAIEEFIAIATPGSVSMGSQMQRAKQATKCAILMNLESRSVRTEDIGKQITTYGKRFPVSYYLEVVDSITEVDITYLSKKILESPLTMVSYGDGLSLPTYDYVSQQLQQSSSVL